MEKKGNRIFKNGTCTSSSLFCITILFLGMFSITPLVYGVQDDQFEIRKQAVYDAEWEFSQAVIKAKQEYMKVISNPNADAKTKANADAIKDKAIADAKIVKDKSIDKARQDYAKTIKIQSSQSKLSPQTQKQPFCFLWWCF
jgi:hypothetical protein